MAFARELSRLSLPLVSPVVRVCVRACVRVSGCACACVCAEPLPALLTCAARSVAPRGPSLFFVVVIASHSVLWASQKRSRLAKLALRAPSHSSRRARSRPFYSVSLSLFSLHSLPLSTTKLKASLSFLSISLALLAPPSSAWVWRCPPSSLFGLSPLLVAAELPSTFELHSLFFSLSSSSFAVSGPLL